MAIPRGSYVGQSKYSTIVLRLDFGQQGTGGNECLSGDLFAGALADAANWGYSFFANEIAHSADQNSFTALLSLRSALQSPAAPLRRGDLSCQLNGEKLKITLSIYSVLGALENTIEAELIKRSDALRTIQWTVNVIEGLFKTAPALTELVQVLDRAKESLSIAGIELTSKDNSIGSVAANPNQLLSERDLATVLAAMYSRVFEQGDKDWRFYFLVATQFRDSSTTGIMFDNSPSDPYQRQGAAIFWNTRKIASPTNFVRDAARTIVHEIGHILNLCHSFEKQGLGYASPSFMNYPQDFRNSENKNYWQVHDNRFDADEERFIRHGALLDVIMGGAKFGFGSHDEAAELQHDLRDLPLRLELRVKPDEHSSTFEFGEPVTVECKLSNASQKTISAADSLDPAHLVTTYILEQPNGSKKIIRPAAIRCSEDRTKDLAPRESIYEDVQISFGMGTHYTLEPGRYRLQASYKHGGNVVRSNILGFWVLTPPTKFEKPIINVLDQKATPEFFSLWGTKQFADVQQPIEELRGSSQKAGRVHPLVQHFDRCLYALESAGYLRYAKGRKTGALTFQKPALQDSLAQQVLMLTRDLKLKAKTQPILSNKLYSTIAEKYIQGLLAENEQHKAHMVAQAIQRYHQRYNARPLSPVLANKLQTKFSIELTS